MASIPVFAFWNAIGTYYVLKEVRIVIMGQNLIDRVGAVMNNPITAIKIDHEILYKTLQYIAISKRDYHYNHYFLTKNLFELFQLKESSKTFNPYCFAVPGISCIKPTAPQPLPSSL